MSCAAELVYIMYHGDHKSHNMQNMDLDILFYSILSILSKVPFILFLKCIYHLPPPYNFRWAISLFCSHIQQRYLIDQVRWIRFEFSNCLSNRAKVKKSPKPIFFLHIYNLFISVFEKEILPAPRFDSPSMIASTFERFAPQSFNKDDLNHLFDWWKKALWDSTQKLLSFFFWFCNVMRLNLFVPHYWYILCERSNTCPKKKE